MRFGVSPNSPVDCLSEKGAQAPSPRRRTKETQETSNDAFGVFLFTLYRGRESGADGLSVVCLWQKNSPVDCFAGGSREASPRRRTKCVGL